MNPLLHRVSRHLFAWIILGANALYCPPVGSQGKVSPTLAAALKNSKALPAEAEEEAIVPFQYEPPVRPFLTIQARLNNSEVLTFMVDTGSEYALLLCPWVEKQLGLKSTGETFAVQPGNIKGHVVEGGKVNIVTQAGSLKMNIDMPLVGVVDLSYTRDYGGPKIAGIIGQDYFRIFTACFDFDRKTLTFLRPNHSAVRPAENSIALPLVGGIGANLPRVEVGLSLETSTAFLIDTGSDSSVVPSDLAKNLSLAVTGIHSTSTNVSATHKATMVLARQVMLGKAPVPLVSFASVEGGAPCVLGLDFLSRFRMTIDRGHQQLLLEPRKNPPLFFRGDPGMSFTAKNGRVTIDRIIHPSLSRADIKAGDKILAVDGENIADIPTYQIVDMLDGYAQTWMDVRLQKPDGSEATAHLLRRSPYPGIIPSRLGVVVAREKDKTWHVLYVWPGSVAEVAGIKAGDAIVRLNGKPVLEMDTELIEETLSDTGTRPSLLQEMVLKRAADATEVTLPKK